MPDLTKFSRRAILAMPLAFAACKLKAEVLEIVGFTMGTTYSVAAVNPARAMDETVVRAEVEAALARVNAQMSNWDPSSEISRFNAAMSASPAKISPDLANVMAAAETVNLQSDGRFDTTMGPLIELWGFGAPGTRAMPSAAEIETARAASGHANTLNVGASTLQKTQPDAQIYLAAIGKGYGADQVGRALEGLGLTDYMIEIGGDLYASGRNPDGLPWQIGVETPNAAGGVMDVIGISGLGLASSGDYRNYFEEDGKRFSHVIDPATGHPINHKTASATVLAENAMLADAWATAMLTLGRERGLEIAEARNLAVLFIERAGDSFVTTASTQFEALTA